MLIIALDPGGTTGYAVLRENAIYTGYFHESVGLDELIENESIVIVERPFRSRATNLVVFEVKGAIIERCRTKDCKVYWQEPSTKNSIAVRFDDLDKRLFGLEHEKDAFKHLLYFLVFATKKYSYEDVMMMYKG